MATRVRASSNATRQRRAPSGERSSINNAAIKQSRRRWLAPIGRREWVTELLNALEVVGVAGHEHQVMRDGDGSDERVDHSDRIAAAYQGSGDLSGEVGFGRTDREHLDGSERPAKCFELGHVLGAGESGHDFGDADRGDGIASKDVAVKKRVQPAC